jgi:hypothetical protein
VVGGARVDLDLRSVADVGADSLELSVFGVRDAAAGAGSADRAPARIAGAEAHVRSGRLSAGGEVLHSTRDDSASVAGHARAEWALRGDAVRLSGGWLRVGEGFASSLNPRLRSGLEEWLAGAEVRVAEGTRLRARHEQQRFRAFDVRRTTSSLGADHAFGRMRVSGEGGMQSDRTGGGESSAALGRVAVEIPGGTEGWLQAQRSLSATGSTPARPDLLGVGVAHRVLPSLKLEGSRRWIRTNPDSAIATVSALMARGELPLGARIWTGLERMEAQGASHAAILGWTQRLALYGGMQVHASLERRFGVHRVPVTDPVRALPFVDPDPDRWTAAWGIEYLPPAGPRFAARQEVRGGASAGWRFDVTAEAPLSRALAVLTRHDWWQDARAGLPGTSTRRDRSLLGLALRPVSDGTLNLLGKLEYRHSVNPLGGAVLAGSPEEWRTIGVGDAIWMPSSDWTLAGRYALRRTVAEDSSGSGWRLRSTAHYLGARAERPLHRRLGTRLDARLLAESVTGRTRWSLAPALAVALGGGLEGEAGYRFGDLQDPDFAAYGRNGFFALLSLRFTEGSIRDVAAFWRERIAEP